MAGQDDIQQRHKKFLFANVKTGMMRVNEKSLKESAQEDEAEGSNVYTLSLQLFSQGSEEKDIAAKDKQADEAGKAAMNKEQDGNEKLSQEDIAKLLANMQPAEAPPISAAPAAEADPNAKMSPEDIAALLASMEPAAEAAAAPEPVMATEPAAAAPVSAAVEADPNAKMSPEDIAALLAAMEPAAEAAAVPEPVVATEPAAEMPVSATAEADLNAKMSPEDIAALLASMEPAAEAAAVPEPVVATEPAAAAPVSAAAEADPNAKMSPEDIAALLASMEPAEEAAASELAMAPEPLAEAPVSAAAEADPNAKMSPEDIAALLATMEPAEEAAASEPVMATEPAAEVPVSAAAEADPNAKMSPEDIAALLASMEPAEETAISEPASVESESSVASSAKTAAPAAWPMEAADVDANLVKKESSSEERQEIDALLSTIKAEEENEIRKTSPAEPESNLSVEDMESLLSSLDGDQKSDVGEGQGASFAEAGQVAGDSLEKEKGKGILAALTGWIPFVGRKKKPKASEAQNADDMQEELPEKKKTSIGGLIKAPFAVVGGLLTTDKEKRQETLAKIKERQSKGISSKVAILLLFIFLPLSIFTGGYFAFKNAVVMSDNLPARDKLAYRGIAFGEKQYIEYVGRGDKNIVNLFLQADMPVDAVREVDGYTALMVAVEYGRNDVMKLLIDKGADVNARDDREQTPLMKAAAVGNLPGVESLIQAGADVNAEDDIGFSAIRRAVDRGWPKVVAALQRAGATPPKIPSLRERQNGKLVILPKPKSNDKPTTPAPGMSVTPGATAPGKGSPAGTGGKGEPVNPKPSSSPGEWAMETGWAGKVEIGTPGAKVSELYPQAKIVETELYAQGRPHPVLNLYMGSNEPSMLLHLTANGSKVIKADLHDPRFKTAEGIGVGSTLADIRNKYSNYTVEYRDGTFYVMVMERRLSFELSFDSGQVPIDWLNGGGEGSLPGSMQVQVVNIF